MSDPMSSSFAVSGKEYSHEMESAPRGLRRGQEDGAGAVYIETRRLINMSVKKQIIKFA